ncbi:hypothetical protein AAFF_G00007100 [Aldrovandia affinis]|uniref:Secreted protein n=1 Tax=Aldrovandia affinis TaxID=143900 RepID=A0AAD7T6Z0_9TELE|nr:hypothetical protein AAFF_G00007100 [Aldrovandia affinis]
MKKPFFPSPFLLSHCLGVLAENQRGPTGASRWAPSLTCLNRLPQHLTFPGQGKGPALPGESAATSCPGEAGGGRTFGKDTTGFARAW